MFSSATPAPNLRLRRGVAVVVAAVLTVMGAEASFGAGGVLDLPINPLASAADPNAVSSTSCRGMTVFVNADAAAVRTFGHVPDRWKLKLNNAGKAAVLVDGASCQLILRGKPRDVVYAATSVVIDSGALPAPERQRRTSNAMGLPFDAYLLSWSSADDAFVEWLRADTGLGDVVRYVPGLTDTLSSDLLHKFAVTAPAPAESPFTFTATTTDSGFPLHPLTQNFWRETPAGSVMIETSHTDPSRFGVVTDWQITTSPTSPLGHMIGGAASGHCTPSELASPIPAYLNGSATPGCLGNDQFLTATWRKDLPPTLSSPSPSTERRPARPSPIAKPNQSQLPALPAPIDLPIVATTLPAGTPAPSESPLAAGPTNECATYASQGLSVAECQREIELARAATAKYADVASAAAAGYVPISGCERSVAGAMGQHWARPDRLIVPSLDPTAPAMLLYLPSPTGTYRLIGAEYEQNALVNGLPYYGTSAPDPSTVSPAPAMFGGKTFDGPMAGHSPVQPWHYDLHVWLWAANPSGIFAQYNPTLNC